MRSAAYANEAVRRALMALARRDDGSVSPLFPDMKPMGRRRVPATVDTFSSPPSTATATGFVDEVLIAAPWACDHTTKAEREERAEFDQVRNAGVLGRRPRNRCLCTESLGIPQRTGLRRGHGAPARFSLLNSPRRRERIFTTRLVKPFEPSSLRCRGTRSPRSPSKVSASAATASTSAPVRSQRMTPEDRGAAPAVGPGGRILSFGAWPHFAEKCP